LQDLFLFCFEILRRPQSVFKVQETEIGSLLTDFLVPNGFPTFIKRRLPTVPPRSLGGALLCPLCCDLLITQRRKAAKVLELSQFLPGAREYRVGCFRHHNDLVLLNHSADSGCTLCKRLRDWVRTIHSDNTGPHFFPFAIRASLWNTEVKDQFKLIFSIARYQQPYELTNGNGLHLLELQMFPKGD